MSLPFAGAATPLRPLDFANAADYLGCDVAALKAVDAVETGGLGGFLSDKRPRILFEAQLFSKKTGGKYDVSNPTISSATSNWSLYAGGAAEYTRLQQASVIDREAALESTSWGLFQILGENFASCGFKDVATFVYCQQYSEGNQLDAFTAFCRASGMQQPLRVHDWTTFARRYNGPLYTRNHYDTRLAAAYAALTKPAQLSTMPLLLAGSNVGDAVAKLQVALNKKGANLLVDGNFGQMTTIAVSAFQEAHGLDVDGIVGVETWELLLA